MSFSVPRSETWLSCGSLITLRVAATSRVLGHLVRNALERFEAVNASRIERKPRNVSVRAGPVRLDKAEAFSLIKKPLLNLSALLISLWLRARA